MKVLQNFQKFRLLGQGRTELAEVPGRYEMLDPYPEYLWYWRTELPEVPGTSCVNVVQNLQNPRVRVRVIPR